MEEAMPEKPQPDRIPDDEPPPHPAEPVQIDTPVIQMQDLEHRPGADTRVPNKGLRVEPTMDNAEPHDFAQEDEEALLALEQIEKSIRGQLPG
jgi:hypothetical protein